MKRSLLFTMLLGLILTLAPSAFADDWFVTGTSVRTKSIGFINVNVYAIEHAIKGEQRPAKSRQGVIDHGADKRFILTMMRDVSQEKIRNALVEALAKNGAGGDARGSQFTGALNDKGPDLEKGKHITISYSAEKKATTIVVDGGGRQTIAGEDFMKSVWKIWFGNIDQRSMGDQLIARLP
jgi:hypothetical protein